MYIIEGHHLTDNVMNATQSLISPQYPSMTGFQDTILGPNLLFKQVPSDCKSVQILHTGSLSKNYMISTLEFLTDPEVYIHPN